MAHTSTSSIKLVDSRDLLEMLRQHPLSVPFNLALYSEEQGRGGLLAAMHTVCAPLSDEPRCSAECCRAWETGISQAMLTNQPVIQSCAQGFICFIVPLPESSDLPDCLLGGGVFEQSETARRKQERENHHQGNPLVLESGNTPQRLSLSEAESMADEISRSLPRLLDQQLHSLSLTRTTKRLEAVQNLTRDLADCTESEHAVDIVSEALVVLFNLPKVLIVLQQPGLYMTVHSTLGLDPESFQLDQKYLAAHFENTTGYPEILTGGELPKFFPGLETQTAHLFPLKESNSYLGAIVILDVNLHSRDQALIELLVNRLASRLESLKTAEGRHLERQFSTRMVAMISELSLVDNRRDLYKQILEMSAELLTATSGSLMLLHETEGTLKIEAAKGMSSSLANTMSVAYGEGIAGQVAKSGFPMLVNDIERDTRVATKNRPRFKTKSFISLPLEANERLIGVLNLADKEHGINFTEADLNLIQTFTGHAVLMIDRAATLEKAGKFEQLAITDPLTGLYNRRFFEDRLQEEFSRGERQQQTFCIILADLDNFKIYNDLCGHLAGDNALRKTAEILRRSAREMDVVTRYGGEEFCLILPGTGKKESVFVGERFRRAIEAESFPGENHLPLGRLTTSIGIATFPADGVTVNELIHAADLALYSAKQSGRNRLVLYEAKMEGQTLLSHQD
ncbi:MAG: GGDEF domain-containing protein [Deltaproteobacteria bacterium]|nr:MAG: GGDEF domain-containing protein [Deltaproteobacteria bacterium]